MYTGNYVHGISALYRGADKSLARPGRKQSTATELTFTSHSKKKKENQKVVRPTRSPRQQ